MSLSYIHEDNLSRTLSVLEEEDKYILENHQLVVKAVVNTCPYCYQELHILNIQLENVFIGRPRSLSQ